MSTVDLQRAWHGKRQLGGVLVDLSEPRRMVIIVKMETDLSEDQLRKSFKEGDLVQFAFGPRAIEWVNPLCKWCDRDVEYRVVMPLRTVTLSHPDHPRHNHHEADLILEYGDDAMPVWAEDDINTCCCDPGHRGLSMLCTACSD